jgi:riboflavin kinase/FMN adenylyltransferase
MTMELIRNLSELSVACREGVCMCIGMFDGVHRGHQMLMKRTQERAQALGLRSLVFTFPEHPLSLLAPPYAPLLLSSPEEKARLIESRGIELCSMIPFTPEFAAVSAQDFLQNIVAGACQARAVICGPDFHFGTHGAGDVDMLVRQGRELSYEVEVCEPLVEGDNPIKSTRIRQSLLEGRIEEANGLLGHPYTLTGVVVEGDRRGRTIGFPTANLNPPERRLVPHNGVYAARATVGGQPWDAMMNIGLRPTFNKAQRSIEVHLFNYSGDLYGQEMRITFVARIREERKFDSVQALIAQLRADEVACRARLAFDAE